MESNTSSPQRRTAGDESSDSSPDPSREPESLLNEVVETLADEDDEENADLSYAVGVDDDQPLKTDEIAERQAD